MRKFVLVVPVLVLAVGGTTACATKTFVRSNVDEVNEKVQSLSRSMEETQERTRHNAERIGEVDQKVTAVDQKAQAASQSAEEAHAAVAKVGARADAIEKRSNRLIFEVVLSEAGGNFKFGQTALPDDVKAALDRLVETLKANPQGAYVEIEGHTDAVGSPEVNQRIGLGRAEAVKRYLYEQYQVPLHRMSVISYGEDRPVAPNDTRDGRAQNRRVVVRILV